MEKLTRSERELVALGAALGSNCVPCIEYHVPKAREAGLTDAQISEAIRLADQVRQVPARKVLDTAQKLLGNPGAAASPACAGAAAGMAAAGKACCG